MTDIFEAAERFRDHVFQPLADVLVVRTGVNCFRAAAIAIGAFVAVDGASGIHRSLGFAWGPEPAFRIAMLTGMTWFALHLVRFQRRSGGTAFRVVHPILRGMAFPSVAYFTLALSAIVCGVEIGASAHMGWADTTWTIVDWGDDILAATGFVLSGCEWRRLPRATRREKAAAHGMLPRGA